MATSLVDIARQLELSPSTISRALNGYSDVASDTLELVLRVADASFFPLQTGFNPNLTIFMLAERCAAWVLGG